GWRTTIFSAIITIILRVELGLFHIERSFVGHGQGGLPVIEKVLAFLGGTSIVAATICGFATLFGKVWVNRIFHKDRIRYEEQMQLLLTNLRNSGEKDLHIHRLQFEKEFEVYSELWKRLLRVNRAASE